MSRMLAVAVVLSAAFTPTPAVGQESAGPVVAKAEVPGIMNFSRLNATPEGGAMIGFGGATQPSAMAWLKGEGFATVINLRLAGEAGEDLEAARAAAKAAGLSYLHMPFDVRSNDAQVVDQVLAALGDRANQPVYIHCASATRVAALWMIHRVLVDGWDVDRAGREAEAIAGKPEQSIGIATQYLKLLRPQ